MFPIQDTIPSRSRPIVTSSVIAANAAVFVFELALGPGQLQDFFYIFGLVPARYTHPEWDYWGSRFVGSYWPFLTSMFVHGGWAHVIGNMWTLWIFGDNVEDRMGHARFLAFYLVTGITAGAIHCYVNPESVVPTVGASGAIAGVLGAYFVLFPFSRVITIVPLFFWPVFVELPAVTYLLFWYLTQLFGGAAAVLGPAQTGGVAWWAHLGGFAAGVVLHRLFLLPRSKRTRRLEPDEFGLEGAWGPWS